MLRSILILTSALWALAAAAADPPYGQNPDQGGHVALNGIQVYYEDYGEGPVVLHLHGNGQGLESMARQLDFFRRHYRVIAPDNRGHGRTEAGPGRVTYEQMAEDANALLDHLGLSKVHVLGWSDGGIVGLLLAMTHPDKVGHLAVMGANLVPEGAHGWALDWLKTQEDFVAEKMEEGDTSQPWDQYLLMFDLLGRQPQIPLTALSAVTAPTLVMSGDRDVITLEHTVAMFQHLPNAQLCIFPGATHNLPWEDPDRFNQIVHKFFRDPFSMPDTRDMFER